MVPVTDSDPTAYAEAVAGYSGFLGWVSRYGHNLVEGDDPELDGEEARDAILLELSVPLSASFNFAYDATDQSIYMAVEPEEFDWLDLMPLSEILIGRDAIYIMCRAIDLGDEGVVPPVALKIMTNQPLLWHAFPQAQDIGFMCVRVKEGGYVVEEFHAGRFPLRFSN